LTRRKSEVFLSQVNTASNSDADILAIQNANTNQQAEIDQAEADIISEAANRAAGDASLLGQIQSNDGEISAIEGVNSAQQAEIDQAESDIDALEIEQADQQTEIDENESEIDSNDVDIAALQTLLSQLTYHEVVEREDALINQTTSNEVYLTNDFTLPALGNYLCTITVQFSYDTTGTNFEGETVINGTTYQFIEYEPKDSAGIGINANTTTGGNESTGTDQRYNATFKKLLTNVSGNVAAAFQFEAEQNGIEAAVYRCTIEMKRVS